VTESGARMERRSLGWTGSGGVEAAHCWSAPALARGSAFWYEAVSDSKQASAGWVLHSEIGSKSESLQRSASTKKGKKNSPELEKEYEEDEEKGLDTEKTVFPPPPQLHYNYYSL